MKVFAVICVLLVVQACTLPESRVSVADERPRIAIADAQKGQTLYVDGLKMGLAKNYNGDPNVLLVEKGRHRIEVRAADGTVIMSEDVYLGDTETRTFSLGTTQ